MQEGFDWDDVKLLLAVCRSGSFNQAAAVLATSQSRVSRRLAQMEERLGVQLFERSVDGVTPTDAATLLLPAAEIMEQAAYSMLTSVTGVDQHVAGTVRVAVSDAIANFILLPRMSELQAAHPEITLELSPSTALIDMSRNEADLALRFVRPTRGELIVQRVGVVTMGLFALADSPWTKMQPEECGWVKWAAAYDHLPDAAWALRHYPNSRVVVRSTNLVSIVRAVRLGLGVALLPHALADEVGGLCELAHPHPLPRLPLWLVGHRAQRDVARFRIVRTFIERCCLPLASAEKRESGKR